MFFLPLKVALLHNRGICRLASLKLEDPSYTDILLDGDRTKNELYWTVDERDTSLWNQTLPAACTNRSTKLHLHGRTKCYSREVSA